MIVAALTKPNRIPVDERLAGEDRRRRKREFAGVRPVSIDTSKDPRCRRERSGGHGCSVPYLPPRLGLPATRTGRPAGHVPVRPAPKGASSRVVLDKQKASVSS